MNAVLPALLTNILVCITFHWNIYKLGYLQQVLMITDSYQTRVQVLLVTNDEAALREAVRGWYPRHPVMVVGPSSDSYAGDTHRYKLLWEHRLYMEQHFQRGMFTTYMYLEDDTYVSWPSMLSWAFDTEALAPYGFIRGFFRTEVDHVTGQRVMLERGQKEPKLNITEWNRKVHLNSSGIMFACPSCEQMWLPVKGNTQQNGFNTTCLAHTYYVQLPQPFMGMWIATHDQLREFINSPGWKKEQALAMSVPYGYPEKTTILNQLVSVPDGFISASVVPYNNLTNVQLAEIAAIAHLRNGYVRNKVSNIVFSEYLQV